MDNFRYILIILSLPFSSFCQSLSPTELGALRTEVIEMCRGGTSSGFTIETQTNIEQSNITFNRVLDAGRAVTIVVNKSEWQGIKALASDPQKYSECVKVALETLTPLMEVTVSIDRNVNARLAYMQSDEFCRRLKHVVSQAPDNFAALKTGVPEKDQSGGTTWRLGPYLMGNPEVVGYSSDIGNITILRDANIRISEDNLTTFGEPMFFTHFYEANSQASYLFSRLENIIDTCIRSKIFRSIKDVSYDGKFYFDDRDPYWEFDVRRGFLKAVSGDFMVTINQGKIDYLETPSVYISLTIFGAKK